MLGGLAVQPVNVPPGTTSSSLGREPLTVPILGTFKTQGPDIRVGRVARLARNLKLSSGRVAEPGEIQNLLTFVSLAADWEF